MKINNKQNSIIWRYIFILLVFSVLCMYCTLNNKIKIVLKGNEKLVQEIELWIMLTIFVIRKILNFLKIVKLKTWCWEKNSVMSYKIFSSYNTRIAYVGCTLWWAFKRIILFCYFKKNIYFSLYYIKFIMQWTLLYK